MGDTACLIQGKIALGESVSFGRFMIDDQSLSWDKWSTFPNKKYVEEAERYAQPGSVAQKKAFFEAHYKKIAARKAAALLEQQNAAKTESEAFAVAAVNNNNNNNNNNNASETAKTELVTVQDSKQDDIASINELNSSIKRPSSKSLLTLMNLVPVNKEPNRDTISVTKKSESSPNDSSTHFKNPTDSSAAPRRKNGHKWHILSAICFKPLTTEGERAVKRKQVKPGKGYRKLSCIFCFKARPIIDRCKDGATPVDRVMQARSTEIEKSDSNNKQSSISVPPPPPPPTRSVNNSPLKNLSKK
ncbi:hypothetical protein CASFOL_033120 [Castilleja foliolosa]|uniref:Uncharacterized protein n=1 Tax=Castilleja foliolosa TaxID=1961234 RepID=A0ABD3C4B9_9LAMI